MPKRRPATPPPARGRKPVLTPESGERGQATFDTSPGVEWIDAETGEPLAFEGDPTGAMAPITLLPTSSVNPAKPRTLAAGYEKATRTLSVIFRDGTPWNYYEVSSLEWANFKRAKSKGRFIRLYLNNHPYGSPVDGAPESQSSFPR